MPDRPRPLPGPRPAAARPRPMPYPPVVETATPAVSRRPLLLRAGAAGAIAAGAVVFVVASVLTPGAGAAPRAVSPAVPPARLMASDVLPTASSAAAPAPAAVTSPRKVEHKDAHKRAAKLASVSVSGLAANGIPSVALNAYRVAAARMASAVPGCGIDWALLAGIGRIESDHGRYGGAVLQSDGTSDPEIMGPPLNGHGTALIPATSSTTALSGDATYTRALGPMQFIPQTWAGYGADADNDGKANIFDIDDAALGAARYLCAAGGDLRTDSGKQRAILAYNHVQWYVDSVLALADAYRRGVSISGIPLGQTTGALPPVKPVKKPASAGTPVGVKDGTSKPKPTGTKTPTSGGTSSPSSTSHAPTSTSRAPSSSGPSTSRAPSSNPPSSSRPPTSSAPPSSSSAPASTSPSPSPTDTCHVHLGNSCVLP